MKEYESDIAAATHALIDELEGVAFYKWVYENATCPKLKAIAAKAYNAEVEHAQQLSEWVHNYTNAITAT